MNEKLNINLGKSFTSDKDNNTLIVKKKNWKDSKTTLT